MTLIENLVLVCVFTDIICKRTSVSHVCKTLKGSLKISYQLVATSGIIALNSAVGNICGELKV